MKSKPIGTTGVLCSFIEKYGDIVAPINDLTKKDVPFAWITECDEAQAKIREQLKNCPVLKPLNYDWESEIFLQVDTSRKAIGIIIYQLDLKDPSKKYFAKFALIALGKVEANYLQLHR